MDNILFGGLVALFRKDWKWAAILIIAAIVLNAIFIKLDIAFGGLIVGVVGGIYYNTIYVKELMKKGWTSATDLDAEGIKQAAKF